MDAVETEKNLSLMIIKDRFFWRRWRDSNSRGAFDPYTISRPIQIILLKHIVQWLRHFYVTELFYRYFHLHPYLFRLFKYPYVIALSPHSRPLDSTFAQRGQANLGNTPDWLRSLKAAHLLPSVPLGVVLSRPEQFV
ncbi:hypothetical protein [Anaerotruncus massiliensis (ex Togo et al. 2019)]|uniref:hypothetical protein n=1 Tax=Anaerotruncus massiliensis (ex Togo et al. 2019) TaxID=1673720 RepID=UPI0023F8EBAE|nr:hypothetical protein [Anaerotruncus massiliensis (ex Togo et al. 2019)]